MPVSSKRLALAEFLYGQSYADLCTVPPDRTYVLRDFAISNQASAGRTVSLLVRTATQGDYRLNTQLVAAGTTTVPQFLRAHVLHPGDHLMAYCDGTAATLYNVTVYVSGASLFGSPPQA